MTNILPLVKDVASILAAMISMAALCISIFSYSRGSEKRVLAAKLNEAKYGLFFPISILYDTSVMAFMPEVMGININKRFLCASIKNNSKVVYDKLIAALLIGFANEIIHSEYDRLILSAVISSLIDIANSDEQRIEAEELYTKQNFLFGSLWIMKMIISSAPGITSSEHSEKVAHDYDVMKTLFPSKNK